MARGTLPPIFGIPRKRKVSDNNGYQFQETYYLNRNEIIYCWLLSTQYTPLESKMQTIHLREYWGQLISTST